MSPPQPREGSLDAPIRHVIDWQAPEYTDPQALDAELTRIFEICHGCRRCFNLCQAFPTLFDAVDESSTGEVESVPRSAFAAVVDHCYLCDMCYMSKCPYVPPHEWNVDFPHLMLRAKVKKFRDGKASPRDRLLSATDKVGTLAGIPVIAETVNAVNRSGLGRKILEKTLGVHAQAPVPTYHSRSARKRLKGLVGRRADTASPESQRDDPPADSQRDAAPPDSRPADTPRVLVLATCYGNRNEPELVEDLVAILEHNDVVTALPSRERCCGMPKLELGDLESVAELKSDNVDELYGWVEAGWLVTAAVPSCVLMFKQELPLLFPDDEKVRAVGRAFVDPFEFLMRRHREGRLKTDFKTSLGSISYHVPCHLRVQNLGLKTRDVLQLVPGTTIHPIERCSGHDGTYAVKQEFHEYSRKIARPVARQVAEAKADHFASDCPMAAAQIATVATAVTAEHPLRLLRAAYGI